MTLATAGEGPALRAAIARACERLTTAVLRAKRSNMVDAALVADAYKLIAQARTVLRRSREAGERMARRGVVLML